MGNKATNTNKQIEILTGRGLTLDYPEAKVKEFLSRLETIIER